jgi:hypothetical protein
MAALIRPLELFRSRQPHSTRAVTVLTDVKSNNQIRAIIVIRCSYQSTDWYMIAMNVSTVKFHIRLSLSFCHTAAERTIRHDEQFACFVVTHSTAYQFWIIHCILLAYFTPSSVECRFYSVSTMKIIYYL